MKLELVCLDKEVQKYKRSIASPCRTLERLFRTKGSIEICLVNGRRMKALNQQFLKKDRSTNVLSFPKPKDFPGEKLGEVYLDPVYIKKNNEDIAFMLVHGVLHILGYDHKKKSDRLKMEDKEQSLLHTLSYGK